MEFHSSCAACKVLRRRCVEKCILSPYFPPNDRLKFVIAHKVFRASNITKLLLEIPEHQRADAVDSLAYEANARIRDSIYGCTGAIFALQNQISKLQEELAKAQAEILLVKMQSPNSYLKSYIAMEMSQQQYINPQQQPCESSSFSVEDGNVNMPIGNANYYFGLEQVVDESIKFKSLSETQK